LPGTIKVGGWRHFGDFDDLKRNDNGGLLGASGGTPLHHDGNHGLYAVIDQMIYRIPGGDATGGISIFARIAGSPSDRNQIDFYADAGLVFTGMIPARPSDVLGVAFAYSKISNDASGFDRDAGMTIVRDYESVLEISYTAEIVPGWYLQPDFQYFWNPGGHVPDPDDSTKAVPNAAVLGLRTTINY
jgi:porin